MQPATQEEIIEAASKMAQELLDLIADAQQCGSDLPGSQIVVDEWEAVFKRTQSDWQNDILNATHPEEENLSFVFAEPNNPPIRSL